jgi:uncharacterized protein
MELKAIQFELKANKGKREVEGYAATYEKDLVNDVIRKNAFQKTIKERLPQNQIKVLWQHDPSFPIGKPIHMEEDSKGLFVVSKLTDGVPEADKAIALIEDNVIDSMSIGYSIVKDEISEDGQIRYLKELQLHEYSFVTFPANPGAAITGMRKNTNMMLEEFYHSSLRTLLAEVKEGRVLSNRNRQTIESAIEALQNILNIETGKAFRADESHSKIVEANPFTQLLEQMKSDIQTLKK